MAVLYFLGVLGVYCARFLRFLSIRPFWFVPPAPPHRQHGGHHGALSGGVGLEVAFLQQSARHLGRGVYVSRLSECTKCGTCVSYHVGGIGICGDKILRSTQACEVSDTRSVLRYLKTRLVTSLGAAIRLYCLFCHIPVGD